jgi:microcystin-dependent protein
LCAAPDKTHAGLHGGQLIAGSLGAIIGQVKSVCTKRIRAARATVHRSCQMGVTTPNGLFRPEQIDLDHENLPPFACINYIIATEGFFPSRL